MAIYHFSMSNVSRAKGSASTATLSYITGQRVEDERLGEVFYGFGRTERVEMTGVILPDEAPQRFYEPAVMMSEIELYEKSDRARPAKKIEVALPRELTPEQQKDVIESFIRENLAAKGYGAVYAVHDDPEHHNPHCHILVPNRQMNAQGWEQTKCRKEFALDERGERIPVIDPTTGQQKVDSRNRKQWKRVNVEVNPLDQKAFLKELRESWAKECNRFLTPEQQIDHRSLKDQGIDLEPTVHEGYAAREMRARGEISDRIQMNENIRARNRLLVQLKEIAEKIAEIVKEKGAHIHDRIGDLFDRRSRAAGGAGGDAADRERDAASRERIAAADRAISERADREAEQERLRAESQREAESAVREGAERSRKKASRGLDLGR